MSLRATSVTPKSLAARPCCGADDSAAARWGVNLTWRRYGRAILIADCIAPLAGVGSACGVRQFVSFSVCQDFSPAVAAVLWDWRLKRAGRAKDVVGRKLECSLESTNHSTKRGGRKSPAGCGRG